MDSQSEIVQNISEETSSDGGPTQKLSSIGSETPKFGLGDLVKRELKGKNFLNIEPHSEKLRKRIVSKRGHVNIGKTRVSKRSVFPYIGQNSVISGYISNIISIKFGKQKYTQNKFQRIVTVFALRRIISCRNMTSFSHTN